ncbi:hypothetical protein E4N62_10090 [Streptomyces sp. MNU76]|uniref:hypothetical protein n=1 Tax=Streptomyces sp. MNU76 TaxID=2560026 RepID=UPI001E3F748F|nr:hypothetical protein [Streptomyces sp. MNU76]MCC9705577.1 hypothetical protein [Streptomyces sp. MNU76]
MAVDQLPGQVREFAGYLNKLMTRLDQGAGWCAVFWQRDPEGMRACLDGLEVPPWDVVEALMHDLDTAYGPAAAAQETQRARALHRASLAAYDSRPGGRHALGDRLDVMLREQRYAADRTADLTRRLQAATSQEEADSLRLDLAWAHNDHERASARCMELRTRIEDADRRAPHHPVRGAARVESMPSGTSAAYRRRGAGGRPSPRIHPAPTATPTPAPDPRPDPGPGTTPGIHRPGVPAPAPRRPSSVPSAAPEGARFAGAVEVEEAPPAAEPVAESKTEPSGGRKGKAPRGARYAGAGEPAEAVAPQQPQARQALDDEARQEIAGTVHRLVRLRREGRSGEAHALLVEVAHWPAARFPLLAAELHRAGLDADWATLLWEAGSLPADRLVAVADALNAVGRAADGEQMLRQGVTRPAEEIGEAVLGFVAQGRDREARALLDVYVRVRTPEEAARSVEAHPRRLAPLVLAAARGVSKERHRDVTHALRVQGLT